MFCNDEVENCWPVTEVGPTASVVDVEESKSCCCWVGEEDSNSVCDGDEVVRGGSSCPLCDPVGCEEQVGQKVFVIFEAEASILGTVATCGVKLGGAKSSKKVVISRVRRSMEELIPEKGKLFSSNLAWRVM